jgi:hypothetical protein
MPEDCSKIGDRFSRLYWQRDQRIFDPPRVLVSQGVGADGTLKVTYSNFPAVFQDSLQAITAPPEDEDLLLFLTVYLRSRLAKYFLFHTSANWGTERDKVLFTELLRIPFPLPGTEYVHRNAGEIVRQIAQSCRTLKTRIEDRLSKGADLLSIESWQDERRRQVDALQTKLEPLIYEYFDLIDQEIILIEDTVDVVIPSATPGHIDKPIPSRAPIHANKVGGYAEGLTLYAETLAKTLNEWAEQSKSKIRVSIAGGVHKTTDMGCVTVELMGKAQPFREEAPSDGTVLAVAKLAQSSATRVGCLDYLRGIIVFDGPRIRVFKPTALIGWTRTAALNDAAEIYARIADARYAMHGSNG